MPAQYAVVTKLAYLTTNSFQEYRKKTFLEVQAAWVGVRKRGCVHVGKDWYKPPRYLSAKWQCLLIAFVTSCSCAIRILVYNHLGVLLQATKLNAQTWHSICFQLHHLFVLLFLALAATHIVVCMDHISDGKIRPFVSDASLQQGWALQYPLIRLCYRTVHETQCEVISDTFQHLTST